MAQGDARMGRRLAAVLAADVVGYSRLMGVDEDDTLARLLGAARPLAELPRRVSIVFRSHIPGGI